MSVKKHSPHHPHNDPGALTRLLEESFHPGTMSNAKWVRLLKALTCEPLVCSCLVKLVWDAEPRNFELSHPTEFQFDFWPKAVESMVSGSPTGWYSYREFEWLHFPACQNLEAIENTIVAVGLFDLEQLPDGLRLYAYRPR